MEKLAQASEALERLIKIVQTLRGPDGCEWDRAQTSKSLRPYLLEEAYEVIESINEEDPQKIKEELGDLLLHIVFQAELGNDNQEFHLAESINYISDKLVRRHPHVFSNTQVRDLKDIKRNWEEIKKAEGRKSLMEGLPKSLPALLQARRIQERAAEVNFEWDDIKFVWEKLSEEIDELKEAVAEKDLDKIEDEMGDVLFSIVNLSRFLKTNPEEALKRTNKKFINRFKQIENHLEARGLAFSDMSLDDLDAIWEQIKKDEKI
ncbi:MAG: nucleoside triphosphate pyrophosphohydrolase [Candidatus Marinimicrobia bacterium]|nr:nucleoside triphosphate pyrophosphohydrolase [Candidatus Neomarinimicrobiota bacterium]